MYYQDVFTILNEKNVRYVVIGGIALVLHGVLRMTVDLDLIIDLEEGNIDRFLSAMKSLGYKPKIDEIDKEKIIISAKGISIPIVSREHLKKLKRLSGRPQDLVDIDALEDLEDIEKND